MSEVLCAWCDNPLGVDKIFSVDLQKYVHYSKIDCAILLRNERNAYRDAMEKVVSAMHDGDLPGAAQAAMSPFPNKTQEGK